MAISSHVFNIVFKLRECRYSRTYMGIKSFIDPQEWVPIHTLPTFEACIEYYINRKGDVLSTKYRQDRILKHKRHKEGYPMVTLTQRIGKGKPLDVCVHKLVAFAFLGLPPTPYGRGRGCSMIDHIDHDKTNCHVNNLRWDYRRHNRRINKLPKIKESLDEK